MLKYITEDKHELSLCYLLLLPVRNTQLSAFFLPSLLVKVNKSMYFSFLFISEELVIVKKLFTSNPSDTYITKKNHKMCVYRK